MLPQTNGSLGMIKLSFTWKLMTSITIYHVCSFFFEKIILPKFKTIFLLLFISDLLTGCDNPTLNLSVFCGFCFVFRTFCLIFKVVHMHESISYIMLYLFACYICYLYINCACNFIYLYDSKWYSVFTLVFVSSCYTIRVNTHL